MSREPWKHADAININGRMLGPKAQEWARERVSWRVRSTKKFVTGEFDPALIAPLTEWYVERFARYVDWQPFESLQKGKRSGCWVFVDERFTADFAEARAYAENRLMTLNAIRAANRFTSLDDWLRADMSRAEIISPEGGSAKMSLAQREALRWRADDRRDLWPRNCRACGDSFKPERRGLTRCVDCRATKARRVVRRALPAPTPTPIQRDHLAELARDASNATAKALAGMQRLVEDMRRHLDQEDGR